WKLPCVRPCREAALKCDGCWVMQISSLTGQKGRDEILIAIGRIEGKLEAFATLSQRVSTLERWQWWLKGGWFATGHNVCVAVSRIPVEVVDDYLPCATSILDGRGRF